MTELEIARDLIGRAEADLGRLTIGQRTDLLMDNMEGSHAELRALVLELTGECDCEDGFIIVKVAAIPDRETGYIDDERRVPCPNCNGGQP